MGRHSAALAAVRTRTPSAWVGAALTVVLLVAACGTPDPPPLVPPTSPDLVRRHHDQVCRVDEAQPPTVLATELFDTDGLTDELEAIGPRPLPMEPGGTEVEWGTVDYVVRYGRDGAVQARGLWDASTDDAATDAVSRILGGRSRALPGLLAEEGFRVVVTLGQPPRVAVAPPIVCDPHVKHPDGGLAYGLPEGASTTLRRPDYPARPGTSSPGQATVRITLDAGGQLRQVTALNGDSSTVAQTRAIVHEMRFDPALRNGVGIPSSFVQTFYLP